MNHQVRSSGRLLLSGLLFLSLFVFTLWVTAVVPARAQQPTLAASLAKAKPAALAPQQTNWCVAGGFQGWNNSSDPMNDSGVNGDVIAADGVATLAYTIAAAGRYEFKVVECGNWGNAHPSQNSWFYTGDPNQVVTFTFDENNHSGDAGATAVPTINIVNVSGDDFPANFTAVGDWQGWNNSDPTTTMTALGHGYYRLLYTIASPGTYAAKIVQTSSWTEQFVNDGRAVDGGVINFTTSSADQDVVFLLNAANGRVTITPNGSGSGNWCVAGDFNGWSNTSDPLNDGGTSGDLVGGDGVYSLDYTITSAGRNEWKAVECNNWGNAYPSTNAFVLTSAPNQVVKFTFDTNDHSGDAGLPLIPTQHIVNAWDDLPASFTVVGPWQGWNNSDPMTAMTNLGGNNHLLNYTFAAAGQYEAKISQTGDWGNQFGNDGRGNNAPTASFDVWGAGDTVQFFLNGNDGRWAIIAPPPGGAGHDNNIFWDDLGHDSRDTLFRSPGGPVYAGTAVTLRLRAASNDLTAARVRLYNDRTNVQSFLNMTLVADDGTYEWWEATLPVSNDPTIYWYRFIAIDGTAIAYYEDDAARDGGWGQPFANSLDNSWQLTMYDPAFNTPDWVKDAVMYQIFPDRFRDGDASNNPPPGRFFYNEPGGTIFRSDPAGGTSNPWNQVVCDPRDAGDPCAGSYSKNFYGGDLQGVIDKLDYLQSLGVTTIYFNPIFESPSNHKYDTADYGFIAEDFGDLATFITLSQEVHNRGMYIVLDGVFNHTSSDSIYFDRYGRYAQVGACESHTSPYRSWYYFTDVTPGTGPCVSSTGVPNGANYTSWFGFDSLPKLNAANPEVRDLIFAGGPNSVAMQWLQHADGWRFDVGGDIDPGVTNDPNNDFWEAFRATTRAQFPDSYMVIEEWGNASAWLLGDEMDATMNYQYSSAMLSFWRDTTFTDNDHNSGSSAGELTPLTPSQLDGRLHNWIERYPPEALYAMMNLLGSHDTNRPLFMLDHNAANGTDHTPLLDPDYDWSDSIARLKGVVLLQMTLPGAPTIYYGDEVGLVGPTYYYGGKWEDDPYNRQPFPWLDEGGLPFYTFLQSQANQDALYDYYAALTAARHAHPALRTGSFDTLLVDDGDDLYGYGRKMADHTDAAIVILNRAGTIAAPQDQTVTLDVAGYLPYGTNFLDVLSGDTVMVDGSGQLTVDVPGQSGVVLVLSGTIAAPPVAVVDLAVTAVRNQEVDLGWSAAQYATSYDVYRSLVSGGGYVWIANTTTLTYTDSGLQNAVPYHYVVVSRDDVSGLVSSNSNEAVGIPAHDLSSAWYNLQWPEEITHTISAITPTENIYAQLWIDGYTGGSGPAQGIRTQIGYAIAGTPPISTSQWTWVEMAYDSAQSNNDQYVGNLLPDVVGDFDYITRWSSDGGNTWYRSDLTGPGDNDNPGLLHVLPSDDTTAPTVTTLYLDGTTAASVSLSWDAVSDPDVAGYELYRQNVAVPGYQRIAQMFGNVTSYEDTDVVTGETYDYYVLAFDTSFNRADPSNVVQATAVPRMVATTFQVAVPAYTPGTVYLVGDIPELGPWNPGLAPMNQVGNTNVWTYTLNILDGTQMQYKYTRGSWDTVESWGSIVVFGNRHVTIDYGTDGTQLVDNTATDWGNGPDDEKAVQYWRDPIVVDYAPVGTNVPVSSTIIVTWSIPMQPNTTFEVDGPAGPVSGVFAYDSNDWTVTFTPDANLATGTFYTVTVAGAQSVGVPGGDSGVQQFPVTWTFLTTPESIQAGFSSNSPIMVGDTAVFTNTTTGQQPLSYEWDFGDGNGSTDPNPTHVYAEPGTYTVTLTATNEFETAVVADTFVVNPEALTAGFVSNSPVLVGDTAVFTNSTTGSGPITYTWDFGDDSGSNETNPTHVYAAPGTYTVTLTAVNEWETAVITSSFVVNPLPLVAAFSSNSPIVVGDTAVFTNSTTGSGPITYTWDFGDDSGSNEASPTHVYAAPGTYTVTLTAVNESETAVATAIFIVNEAEEGGTVIYLPVILKP
ncbi:MAG: alpha amylase N-terminal ig-like domain-containing protein [Anaerolineae bacterium]|nr:alpha amylase N-terminal ig-like domain-containing protein [Anaerolineae bacterium]